MVRGMVLIALAGTGCGGSALSPVTSDDQACTVDTVHIWRIRDARSGLISAHVDTINADTAFDPELFLYTVETWGSGPGGVTADEVLRYDDNSVQCSFRPVTDYTACAQVLGQTNGVTEDLLLLVGIRAACASDTAGYELTVSVDARPARISFEGTGLVDPYVVSE